MEEFLDPRPTVFMAKNHTPALNVAGSGQLIPTNFIRLGEIYTRFLA